MAVVVNEPGMAGMPSLFAGLVGFTRELMPTWLHATTTLAGHRPPDLAAPFTVVDLRCGTGINAAVIAACHPHARVVACSDDAAELDAAGLLARSANLGNLEVVEIDVDQLGRWPRLPGDVDIVLIDELLTMVSAEQRRQIATAASSHLRPGGIAVAAYRTSVGWSELLPLRSLLRLAAPDATDDSRRVGAALALAERLRLAEARYLCERPRVGTALDELGRSDADLVARYFLNDHLEPLDVATAHALFAGRCAHAGSARVGAALAIPEPLRAYVDDSLDPVLREVLRDLATRPSRRVDVFRRPSTRWSSSEHEAALGGIELELLSQPIGSHEQAVVDAAEMLARGPATVATIAAPTTSDEEPARLLRVLMHHGIAHPRTAPPASGDPRSACRALNAAIAAFDAPPFEPVVAVATIGSAVAERGGNHNGSA